MFCQGCGGQMPEGAAFCMKCGRQIGAAPAMPQRVAPQGPMPPMPPAAPPGQGGSFFGNAFKFGCLYPFAAIFILALIGNILGVKPSEPRTGSAARPAPAISTPAKPVAAPSIPKETPKRPDLEVLSSEWHREGPVLYVVGKVRNNRDRPYSYAQVMVNLYDDGDTQVGSTVANVNNLDAGKTWAFKAVVIEDAARRFEVKDVTGW